MALRIEWHPAAIDDLSAIGAADQKRIRNALQALTTLDDARQRLSPYTGSLKGFWKLRFGDDRLSSRIEREVGATCVRPSPARGSA